MTRFEKRKQTMIENIMRVENVPLEEAERIFYEKLSQAGRRGGKSTGETKRRDPEHYQTIGKKGAARRWHGKNPEV